jgi:TM2 domain-containing membrane protein YozV
MKNNLSLLAILVSFGLLTSCSKNIAPFQKSNTVTYEANSIPILERNEGKLIISSVNQNESNSNENSNNLTSSTDPSFTDISKVTLPQIPSTSNIEKLTDVSSIVSTKELSYSNKKITVEQIREFKKIQKEIKKKSTSTGGKSQLVALILAAFVGVIGIHRFYLGYTTYGILQLLTGGGCGVWAIIDLIRIATGDLKPKGGDYSEKF